MSLLDFTKSDFPDIPTWLINKTDATLMLWAGDCINAGVTDVARLPGYDVYLCLGLQDLSANLLTISANPFCISVIDIYKFEQIKKLTTVFSNKFKTIDADYIGNTPTLPDIYYINIMQNGGKAYSTAGINSGPSPEIILMDSIELFVPVLPDALKPRRDWTKEMLQLAADNNMPVELAWISPDLSGIEYANIRASQSKYSAERSVRFPYQFVRTINDENISLEEHWNKLMPVIFEADYTSAFSLDNIDQSWLEPFKPRLATYLRDKIAGNFTAADNAEFEKFYAAQSDTVDNQVKALQHVLKLIRESKSKVIFTGLIPSFQYYKDMRIPNSDQMIFGIVYSKPYPPEPEPSTEDTNAEATNEPLNT